jgi:tetratricopeptide (TPR) repeat protein
MVNEELNPVRIALCMIVKDDSEADLFSRCIESFGGTLSGLFVAVTGVSGEHKKIHAIVAGRLGTSISTSPETHPEIYTKKDGEYIFSNFAAARNISFGLVDEEFDYLTWADTDDVISDPVELYKVAQLARKEKLDAVYFPYWYAVRTDEEGKITQVIVEQVRERLLKPNVYKWISRLHEVCDAIDPSYKQVSRLYEYDPKNKQLLTWIHTSDFVKNSKISGRNLDILKIQAEEEKYSDPRTLFYLAKTYFDMENYAEAETLLDKYLATSGWDAERSSSLEYKGLIRALKGDYRKCIEIYTQAIHEYPLSHLPYLRLADAYLQLGQVDFSKHWLNVALHMEPPKAGPAIGNTFEIKLLAATLQYNMARIENDIDKTLEWAKIRRDLMDRDDGLYEEVLKSKNLNTAATGFYNLSKWLKENGHEDKIFPILETLPSEVVNQPYISILYKNVLTPKIWGKKEICYYAVAGIEEWTPDNLAKGIGGSELAVIKLAKIWQDKGYKVTVFNDCGSKAGVYDGVTYKPYWQMNWNDHFNTLILWRNPSILDMDIKAKKIFVDLHDIASQTDWTQQRMDRVDKVFFKSHYHRSNLPRLADNKCVVLGNGI